MEHVFEKSITENSLIIPSVLSSLLNLLMDTKGLDGDCCEVGVYKGGSARLICKNTDSIVYLIDTFEGLPDVNEYDTYCKPGMFSSTIPHLLTVLEGLGNFEIIKGIWPRCDTSQLDEKSFRFVHLDVDIYSSLKECLYYFIPKMVKGGYIISDDYSAASCSGARKAMDEIATEFNLKIRTDIGKGCQGIFKF